MAFVALNLVVLAWTRTIAVAGMGPTGLAVLGELCQVHQTSTIDLQVRALCKDEDEERRCRQAVCGAKICEGTVSDFCARTFPALSTHVVLRGACSTERLQASLLGCSTLMLLEDALHPVLNDVAPGEQVVMLPYDSHQSIQQRLMQSVRLIDAAAEVGVQHVILHSALGASAESRTLLQTERMGGEAHLSLRRSLEQHLEAYSSSTAMQSEQYSSAAIRHTILRAAPYASAQQLAERRMRDDDIGRESATMSAMPPLASPELLAREAVKEALYTRPNTLKRRVAREVVAK